MSAFSASSVLRSLCSNVLYTYQGAAAAGHSAQWPLDLKTARFTEHSIRTRLQHWQQENPLARHGASLVAQEPL